MEEILSSKYQKESENELSKIITKFETQAKKYFEDAKILDDSIEESESDLDAQEEKVTKITFDMLENKYLKPLDAQELNSDSEETKSPKVRTNPHDS